MKKTIVKLTNLLHKKRITKKEEKCSKGNLFFHEREREECRNNKIKNSIPKAFFAGANNYVSWKGGEDEEFIYF